MVLSHNHDIMSQYIIFKCSKNMQITIQNFQCPGVTRITIPTRISLMCSQVHALQTDSGFLETWGILVNILQQSKYTQFLNIVISKNLVGF